MGLFDDRRFWLSAAGVVLSGLGLLATLIYAALTLLGGLAGGSLAATLSGLALPLTAAALLLVVLLSSAVGLALTLASYASVPRSDRLAALAARAEREFPPLSALNLSDRLAPPEPTADERIDELKRRYVEGELSEREFERRVDEQAADAVADSSVREGTGDDPGREPERERA